MIRPSTGPMLVVEEHQLSGLDPSPGTMAPIPGSRMFEIKEALSVFRERRPGSEVYDASQGDGGASLPGVPGRILDEAHRLQREHGTGYDKPFGTQLFRTVTVEEYWRLEAGTGWGPANIIACQGGRDALVKAYDAALNLGHGRRGDFVVVSRVPWISYNWGPYSVGANVILAPGDEAAAWALTPEGILECVEFARARDGRRISMVVVTSPDNPTGRTLPLEEQIALARSAFAAGVPYVLFDWIYHRVTTGEPHDLNRFLGELEPPERERCIILDGITKSLGASNIRCAHLVASEEVVRFIQARASHAVIPSFHSQAVAIAAYREGFDSAAENILGPTNASRSVLTQVLDEAGLRHVIGDGYYAFIDVGDCIDRCGLADGAAVGARLAMDWGLAVVPGVYFSTAGGRWLRFSYALPPDTTRSAALRLAEAVSTME